METIRNAFRQLLDGTANGRITGLDDWQTTYDNLYQLYQEQGAPVVRRIVEANKDLVRLLSNDPAEYRQGQPVPTAARELAQKDIPPTRYFIDGILRSGLALFIGNPGVGKTPALLQLGIALAHGGHWMGAFPCPQCRVLYIGVEYDEAYLQELLIESYGSCNLPDNLFVHTVETFTPPATEDESINMMDFYISTMQMDTIIIDTFSGFLPREKFKQDKYRGDYAEFLAYHRIALKHNALIVGAWHGGKHNKDPETAYNGGQGMWGSAGGGRLTMFRDEDQEEIRMRSQLRGHDRREWVLQQTRVDGARFWSVIDADPEPILGSEIQKRVFRIIRQYSSRTEPITPAGIHGLLKADDPTQSPKEATIRKTIERLTARGILTSIGGGYVLSR